MNTVNFKNSRNEARIDVQMKLRAALLPGHVVDLVDISNHGARVRVKGFVSSELQESTIRFGVSERDVYRTSFEGLARVAWVRSEENGLAEIGLEWEKMTPSAWSSLKRSLLFAS